MNGVQQYRAALDAWLICFDWHHWVTLTSMMQTPDAIWKRFDVYVRNLERVSNRRIQYVASLEETAGGYLHIHAALAGTRHLHVSQLDKLWHDGHRRVRVYDPSRRGLEYGLKHVTPGDDRWRISRTLPPVGSAPEMQALTTADDRADAHRPPATTAPSAAIESGRRELSGLAHAADVGAWFNDPLFVARSGHVDAR